MGQINWGRVLLGGIVAGIVLFLAGWLIYGVVLGADLAEMYTSMNRTMDESASTMALYGVLSLVVGLVAIWLYAAARPRFGPGPGTAIRVALAAWLINSVVPTMGWIPANLFTNRILGVGLAGDLASMLVATLIGAWLYKEAGS